MINNSVCFSSCMPPPIITLTEAINDFSILQITTGSGLADNCCIKWSYSLDGAIWSSWMPYESAANILFEQLMGTAVAPRKQFIKEHSKEATYAI